MTSFRVTRGSLRKLRVLLAGLTLISSACSAPSVTSTPRPSVTPVALPSTPPGSGQASSTPTTGGRLTDLRWDRDQTVFADSELFDVVAGGPGFVAVGESGNRESPSATAWSSTSGHAWSATPLDVSPSFASAVVAGRNGLVAVGEASGAATIWTSTDGAAWAKVTALPDPGGRLGGVTTGGPGYMAAGRSSGGQPAIWLSTDGMTWTQVIPNPTLTGTVTAVQKVGSTIYAVATDDVPGPHQAPYDAPRRVWTSVDGRSWTPSPDGSIPPFSEVATAAVGGQIMILGSSALDSSMEGWTTDDGTTWYRAFETSPAKNGSAKAGTSANGQLVLAGVLVTTPCCTVPALWTDVGAPGNGSNWMPQFLEFEGDPPGSFYITSVAAVGTTVVGVGQLQFVTADCAGCIREGVVVTATLVP